MGSVGLWGICISVVSLPGPGVGALLGSSSVSAVTGASSWVLGVAPEVGLPSSVPLPAVTAVDVGVAVVAETSGCFSTTSGAFLLFFVPLSSLASSSSPLSPSSLVFSSPAPSCGAGVSSEGPSASGPLGAVCWVVGLAGGGVVGREGAWVGQRALGREEMTPPPKPRPASKVLVTTDATVVWLPLDDGPMPVAMETKEKGSPEEVQVEDPELMGAMSAEDAGDTVGWRPESRQARRAHVHTRTRAHTHTHTLAL